MSEQPRYISLIELNTEAELLNALERSNRLFQDGVVFAGSSSPVNFVLHGPEVHVLLKKNYLDNQALVDLAAKLSAFGIIDLKVCETWMGGNRVRREDLPSFVTTVPYGPAETRRLQKEGYVYF